MYQFRKLFFKTLIYDTNDAQFLTVRVKVSESPIKIIIGGFFRFLKLKSTPCPKNSATKSTLPTYYLQSTYKVKVLEHSITVWTVESVL